MVFDGCHVFLSDFLMLLIVIDGFVYELVQIGGRILHTFHQGGVMGLIETKSPPSLIRIHFV